MKKMTKRLLTVIAALAVFLIPIANAQAATQTISIGPATKTGTYIGGVRFHYKKTVEGKFLYCVDMNKETAANITADLVTSGSVVDGGIFYILKNGYPEKSITGNADKDYYITQTAIWWYLDETTGSSNLGEMFKSVGDDEYGMRSIVKNLVNEGIKHRYDSHGITNYTFGLTSSDSSMTLQGDYYVSKTISLTSQTNIKDYKVSLEGAPQGTIIEVNGQNNTSMQVNITGGQSFKIKVPASSVTKDFSIKVKGTATSAVQYDAFEYKPRDASMQSVALLEKVQKSFTSEVNLNVSLASKVSIVKIDANTEQPIAGAVLVLRDATGKELSRWTSTTKAHIFENLPYGTYTVEEIEAPKGYSISNKETKFTLSESNKDIKVLIKNTAKSVVVNITKVDQATGEALAGAVLVIKDANGNIVYKFTSGTTSEIITDLENGTYTIEEESAPEGYIKSDQIITFTIDDEHLSHQITFENAKEYYVPNTGSASSMIMIILGIVITGLGLKFVYKNGQKTR